MYTQSLLLFLPETLVQILRKKSLVGTNTYIPWILEEEEHRPKRSTRFDYKVYNRVSAFILIICKINVYPVSTVYSVHVCIMYISSIVCTYWCRVWYKIFRSMSPAGHLSLSVHPSLVRTWEGGVKLSNLPNADVKANFGA